MLRPRITAALLVAAGVLVVAARLSGQQAQDPPLRDTDPPTFRTGTELVTVDAVVVDREGHHVTDLGPGDFEVTLAGRRQRVRQAVYVPAGSDAVLHSTPIGGVTVAAAVRRLGPTPFGPRRQDTGRVMAVVVDDLGLSFESTAYVRRALTTLVDEQLQPNDLVAILRTGAGVGALQQFTTDKRLLHAAIDRVRWTIVSRFGIGAFAPIDGRDAMGGEKIGGSGTAEIGGENTIERLRTNYSTVGSLAALEYVIRGVQDLPGRKSVLFVSDGLTIFDRPSGFGERSGDRVWNRFTSVMDAANRAGVIVYTMDARGLQSGRLQAEDNPQSVSRTGSSQNAALLARQSVDDPHGRRVAYLRDSQEALHYIAEQTGGFAVVNNDLNLGFRRVLDDLAGYYLLGFERPLDDERGWDPGRLKVGVQRDGLRVRSRKGLFGPADPRREETAPPGDPLVMAAFSPFGGGDVDVRLTALFGHDGKTGSYVRSLFFIDPAGIDFVKNDAGQHEATITVLLLMLGDNGAAVSQLRRPVTLRLDEEPYRLMRQRGLLYNARLPIKENGGYQMRAAVRDERSGRLGSASQFVEVPRVGKGRLTLSGVVLQGLSAADADKGEAGPATADAALEEAVLFESGVRIFQPGSDAVYAFEIYDGLERRPERALVTSTALLRDGRVVYESPTAPVSTRRDRSGLRVVPVTGRVTLGRRTPPGVYTLRVTVAEQREGKPVRESSQWIDFDVRR